MAAATTEAERGDRRPDPAEQAGPGGPSWRGRLPAPPSRRTLVVAGAVAALLAAGVVWLLYGSAWLRVGEVGVAGTRVLGEDEVRRAAAVPDGLPLASVDTEAVEARVRGALPRVKSVEADRDWPHGVTLRVTERTAVLILAEGDGFTEVDATGVRFATLPKAPGSVPLLELDPSSARSATSTLRRFGRDRLVREAVRVARDIPDQVARSTRRVKVRTFDAFSLELKDGRTVRWGSPEDGAAKARTLQALMKATPRARHFDVSVPSAPASSAS
ncbi:FtsQ-type POTRA domain-containing protein [Streptomyces sp. NPDC002734]|uniref:cell division protein FtsQ/DivIB n=1 Tax=Streptomyces sp. NPDC002734 TaxID=3154426 RepID=UPI0033348B6A